MVGAGTVVAQTLAGESAQKDGTRVFEQRLPLVRVVAGHFQMLGRDAVADVASLLHAACVYQSAAAIKGRGDDVFARHFGQQFVDGRLHRGYVRRIGAQQNALCQFVVFGL